MRTKVAVTLAAIVIGLAYHAGYGAAMSIEQGIDDQRFVNKGSNGRDD